MAQDAMHQPAGAERSAAVGVCAGLAPDLAAIHHAAARIQPYAVRTPLLRSPELDAHVDGRVYLKAENLQRSGSFKFRGACNRILCLSAAERARGVVAYSSGNHALAVSEAGRLLEVPVAVVMPTDAPAIKIQGCRARGATVLLYDRERDDREAIGQRLVDDQGMTLVPPFDDALVMAGAGTGALEAIEQLQGRAVDTALLCCSGGGLAAGWAVALRAAWPRVRIVVVEPEDFDDTGRSLRAGVAQLNTRRSGSIQDALLAPAPGLLTLPLLRAHEAGGVAVSDDETLAAMSFAFASLKLVLEPGGAAALAAALAHKVALAGRDTLVICSGGNVDPWLFARCLRHGEAPGAGEQA